MRLILSKAISLGLGGKSNRATLSPVVPSTLLNGLVRRYSFDETSGTRFDSITPAKDLTDNNTVAPSPYGPIGNVADYAAALTQDLKNLNMTDKVTTALGVTISGWFRMTLDSTMFQYVAGSDLGGTLFSLERLSPTQIRIIDRGIANKQVIVTTQMNVNKWYFIAGGYDPVQKKLFLSVNGATPTYQTDTYASDPISTGLHQIFFSNIYDQTFTGQQGRYLLHNRKLSDAEILKFFNNGIARDYSLLNADDKVGLVSAWDMRDVSDSHGANTLTNLNGVAFTPSVAGAIRNVAAAFISSNIEYLSNASNLIPDSDWSVSYWFNTVQSAALQVIWGNTIGGGNAKGIQQYVFNGNLVASAGDGTNERVCSAAISNDTWIHVAITYSVSDKVVRPYINGSAVSPAAALIANPYNASNTIMFGAQPSTHALPWSGYLDEPLIYNRVLTAAEITRLAAGAIWPFTGLP